MVVGVITQDAVRAAVVRGSGRMEDGSCVFGNAYVTDRADVVHKVIDQVFVVPATSHQIRKDLAVLADAVKTALLDPLGRYHGQIVRLAARPYIDGSDAWEALRKGLANAIRVAEPVHEHER